MSACRTAGLDLHAGVDARGLEVELTVAPGEVVALLGPNGAGKSTALGLVAGLLRPDRGRVVLDGDVLADAGDDGAGEGGRPSTWVPPHRRRTALLAQDPLLFGHLTALENAAFAPRARGVGRADARATARRWLDRVGAGDLADRRPAQLSGGQAQRVALARALAAEPRLLLLDEPLAALDVAAAPALRQLLREVLRAEGRSALLVTHDPLDVLALADRAVVLEHGRVVETGPAADVLATPRSAFATRLSGLSALRGTAEAGGLRTDDGRLVPGRLADGCRPGDAALVHLAPDDLVPAADDGSVRMTVAGLEPRGGVVLVRGEDADDGWPGAVVTLPAGRAAALGPGDRLELDPGAATTVRAGSPEGRRGGPGRRS
ncbi:sulfate/molybdate ABC transporter ATP-binding protein [uncultured Pseudokineococcus sp.]|uniref:sulfate/molybdate ABC transporter ATP-binding protein n=1 Tax=uncultured Pseudokineococcus sp. TaxID=1642928 RepID=UPI00262C0EAF|nr:ATP-binding cassette domain-containing protein [uncultured Pseudokineococcus sp.]